MSGLTLEQGQRLLKGEFSDLSIAYDRLRLQVHRNVVCVASPVIDKLCSAQSGQSVGIRLPVAIALLTCDLQRIELQNPFVTPIAFARLMQLVYTGKYSTSEPPLALQNVLTADTKSNTVPSQPFAAKADLPSSGDVAHIPRNSIDHHNKTKRPMQICLRAASCY